MTALGFASRPVVSNALELGALDMNSLNVDHRITGN